MPPRRVAWIVPLAGFAATWLLAVGFSLSNADVRSQAETVGLAVLWLWPVLGLLLLRRCRFATPALVVNTVLLALVAGATATALTARGARSASAVRAPTVIERPAGTPKPVWLDADPACGWKDTSDVDDCWALALAARAPELQLVGVSTVFGNPGPSPVERAELARTLLRAAGQDVPVVPGSDAPADGRWRPTPASKAMAEALMRTRLTIVAQGPATNVATLLLCHPEVVRRIDRIVFVGGKSPGRLFHPGRHWWFHFSDFNVSHDVASVQAILDAGVPVTLVPFDLAITLTIGARDLEQLRRGDALAAWLAERSEGWLEFWQGQLMDSDGFSPFDALAVGQTAWPGLFTCRPARARIGFSVFLAPFDLGRDLEVTERGTGTPVRYCDGVQPPFKPLMLQRLRRAP
ncbi:MAG: nucleoside hydrolase [Burkholderiaceae bacterium]|nr:nucleoside hydrolase [Burkholderiaceae bacterium]